MANDVVAIRMAGPGIRCFELGRGLAADGHQVTLVGMGSTDLASPGFTVSPELGLAALERLARSHDLVMVEGTALLRYPVLREVESPLVMDLYDPFPIALLGQEEHLGMADRERQDLEVRAAVSEMLALGDYFICASETQRDLWLGSLLAAGRLNPRNWSRDPTFRQLIDVVPFGLPEVPPPVRERGSRLPLPGVEQEDLVLLWGGGIYNWFDPLTLIQAVARVDDLSPPVKLVFMSTSHPNSGRTHDGDEVDLIIERDDGAVVAFEVKASARVPGQGMRSLAKLRDAVGPAFIAGVALYLGSRSYTFAERLLVLPVDRIWTPVD